MKLKKEEAMLIVIDVQGKLAQSMNGKEFLFENLEKLAKCARLLELPVLWMEQLPDKLGPTIENLASALEGHAPVSKSCFDCTDSEKFREGIAASRRNQLILCGIEAHICVLQTALGLRKKGFEVFVVADAVSSRTKLNQELALKRLEEEGVFLTSVEMAVFEMMEDAEKPSFKEVLKIIK